MASNAFTGHLEPLLVDAAQLLLAVRQLPAGVPGRRVCVAALNRAVVVSCVSAWEAYIEELVREALTVLRPPVPPLGVWPALNASVRSQLGRFHTPNIDNVRALISDSLGLQDIQTSWAWTNCSPAQAAERLEQAMTRRHRIAHGVNPRPEVATRSARRLPEFFLRLGRCTDRAVRDYFVNALGIANPWPP